MSPVPINDMQIPPQPPPLKSGQIGVLIQEDAICSETYDKQFSDFLEKLLIVYSNSKKIRTDFGEPDLEMLNNVTR